MNGQTKDKEVFEGFMSADFWGYDSRLGRRWEQDPLVYKWQSPYATFNNNPIYFADPLGLEGEPGDGESHQTRKGSPGNQDKGNRGAFDFEKGESNPNRKASPSDYKDFSTFKSAIYPIYEDLTPAIYKNAQKAILYKPTWANLTYGGFSTTMKNQNRYWAGCGPGNGCSSLTGGEYQCEEFPVACSFEGGCYDAFVTCVPTDEQKIQAGTLSVMISYFGLNAGDNFMVVLFPSIGKRVPAPVPFPVPFPSGYKKEKFPRNQILEPIQIYDPDLPVFRKLSKENEKKVVDSGTSITETIIFIFLIIGSLSGG